MKKMRKYLISILIVIGFVFIFFYNSNSIRSESRGAAEKDTEFTYTRTEILEKDRSVVKSSSDIFTSVSIETELVSDTQAEDKTESEKKEQFYGAGETQEQIASEQIVETEKTEVTETETEIAETEIEGSRNIPDESDIIGQTETMNAEMELFTNIDLDAWNMMLVNSMNALPEDFTIELATLSNGYEFDARAVKQLQSMLEAGAQAGMKLWMCSAYRTVSYQESLFNKQVQKWQNIGYSYDEAVECAKTVVLYPGYSEHNLGLATDIAATYYQVLDSDFAQTQEGIWLKENCADYGFILRYPEDKTDITGVIFEPWHFRYVGEEAAHYIMNEGICLEEFIELAESYHKDE